MTEIEQVLYPKYNVERVEKDGVHYYSVDGMRTAYPGATSVLGVVNKHYLLPWAAKVDTQYFSSQISKMIKLGAGQPIEEILLPRFLETLQRRAKKQHILHRDKAANIGTRTHQALEDMIQGREPKVSDDIRQCLATFADWDTIKRLRIIQGDTKLINLINGYGGSLDAIAVDEKGMPVIIDWKTSNQLGDEMALQAAAYSAALQFTCQLDFFPEAYIIRFDKVKPRIEVAKVRDIHDCFEAFLGALRIYQWQNTVTWDNKKTFKPNEVKTKKGKSHDKTA